MIFDTTFSEIGRSSGQQLDALRRQLGVGIDPSYDYSHMEEMQKKLIQKKDKKFKGATGDSAGQDAGGPVTGLDQLRRALREVVGSSAGLEEPILDEAGGGSPG